MSLPMSADLSDEAMVRVVDGLAVATAGAAMETLA
jgi:hypothetical protein